MRALAILLAVILTGLTACGSDQRRPMDDRASGGGDRWERLADSPLSPRWGPVAAYVGGRAVFVGGDTGRPCPPTADCAIPPVYAVDGAAYDPSSLRWRAIARAPHPVAALAPRAVVGDRLYILTEGRLLSYDAARDAWTTVPTPVPLDGRSLTAVGRRLVFTHGSDEHGEAPDRVLDTRTGRWSTLPDDPIGPAYDRVITATPHGLVLTAHELVAQPGSEKPSLVLAARMDPRSNTWTKLPVSDQIGGWRWAWTGSHLVDPTLGGADGGGTGNWGRWVPDGGLLDPATGRWARLPDPPQPMTGGWPVEAIDGRVTAAEGWLFDDDTDSWTRLPRPQGAPPEPGSAVWADDLLVVLGGADHAAGDTAAEVYATSAWAYRLAG
jgi:hypothetical protein